MHVDAYLLERKKSRTRYCCKVMKEYQTFQFQQRISSNVSRLSVAALATMLMAGRSGVRISVGAGDFSLLNVKTGSWAHPAFYCIGAGIPSREYRGPDVKLAYPFPSRICLQSVYRIKYLLYHTNSVEVCNKFWK
jgi:hypothetical protein